MTIHEPGLCPLRKNIVYLLMIFWLCRTTFAVFESDDRPILQGTGLEVTQKENFQDSQSAPREEMPRLYWLMKQRQYDEAIFLCKKMIAKNALFPEAYQLLLQALECKKEQGHPDSINAAIDFLQGLLRENPGNFYYHYGLGLCYTKQKNYPQAKEEWKRSISAGADFGEPYSEFLSCYRDKQDLEASLHFFSETLRRNPSNPFLYQGTGVIRFFLSEYQKALSDLEKALKMHQKNGNQRAEGKCLLNLSDVYMYLNDYPRSREMAERGLKISQISGDRTTEAECLERISFINTDLGNYSKALELCEEALSHSLEICSRNVENLCYRTLGVINLELGNFSQAQRYLEKSLKFYEERENLRSQDICLYWLTLLFKDKGDYSLALDCAWRALKISHQIGFKTGEAFHLTALGDISLALGNYDRALEFNKQALAVTERYIGKWSRGECLNTIGFVYAELNDYPRALEYFKEGLNYILQIGHKREEAECLSNIGFAHLKSGDYENAQRFFRSSLSRAHLSGKRMIQAFNYNRLGDLCIKLGRLVQARKYYEKARSIGQEIGQPSIVWEAYAGLGSLCAKQKQFPQAVEYYKKSIGVIEDIRNQILLGEYSSGFFKSKVPIYEELIDLLYDMQALDSSARWQAECLGYAERAKARSFLDDLQSAKIGFGAMAVSKSRQEEINMLSGKISHLVTKLNTHELTDDQRNELMEEIKKAEEDYAHLVEIVKRENPKAPRAIYQQPCQLEEIQNKLLDNSTALVEYFVGEKNIFIFVVTRENLKILRLPPGLTLSTLRLVHNYTRLLSSKEISSSDCLFSSQKLYHILFQEVAGLLPDKIENLIIVPDRSLYYLPFETLSSKFHFLMEDYKISYAPSASTLLHILDRNSGGKSQRDLLAIGDPVLKNGGNASPGRAQTSNLVQKYYIENRFVPYPLAFASQEISSIEQFIRKDSRSILSQQKATEKNVKNMLLGDFQIIHFATHSLLDEKVASRSALVLTPDDDLDEDGFFQAREIYSVRLKADLVVLSACQTARGKMERGEGIQGLARAFLCAGSKSVVASLWNISDQSTSEFMKCFYKYLARGKTKQEALRLTKLKMLRSSHSHPYHWAAFVLTGEANSSVRLHSPSFFEKLASFTFF